MEQTKAQEFHHVAAVASCFANGSDEQIVAFLHDTVEDGYLTLSHVFHMFGRLIRDAVDIITRRDGETYDDYIDRIIAARDSGSRAGEIAHAVKLADNGVNLLRAPRHLRPRYMRAKTKLTCTTGGCTK